MTTKETFSKIIKFPYEGFIITVSYPKTFIDGLDMRHLINVEDMKGNAVIFDSEDIAQLLIELKNRADFAVENKRANDYAMPSVINQIGVGTDKANIKPKFHAYSAFPPATKENRNGSPFDSFIDFQTSGFEVSPDFKSYPHQPNFNNSRFFTKLEDGSILTPPTNAELTSALVHPTATANKKDKVCLKCNGDGYSMEAKRLKDLFYQEIQYKLTESDITALISAGCLKDLTHYHNGSGWVPNAGLEVPTLAQVRQHVQQNILALDSRAANVVIKNRMELYSLNAECSKCKGSGQNV